jgi:hypothetical protein
MGKFNSAYKYMYDAAPEVALVPKDHAAHAASFAGAAVALPQVQGWWNQPQYPAANVFAIAVNVEALDHTTGDETYSLAIEFGTDGTFGTKVVSHTLAAKKPGQLAALVDMDTIVALLGAAPTAVRVNATLAGTTPSITLHAWLAGSIVDAD